MTHNTSTNKNQAKLNNEQKTKPFQNIKKGIMVSGGYTSGIFGGTNITLYHTLIIMQVRHQRPQRVQVILYLIF